MSFMIIDLHVSVYNFICRNLDDCSWANEHQNKLVVETEAWSIRMENIFYVLYSVFQKIRKLMVLSSHVLDISLVLIIT